jgi:hypothetical protein
MVDIDLKQYRMLKKVDKHSSIDAAFLSKEEKDICAFLLEKQFLAVTKSYRRNEQGDIDIFNLYPKEYSITQAGKAQIYAFKSTFYKWWIPVIISIFSAIGAYRAELACILRAIMKLLK